MFWMRNKENNFTIRNLIWRPGELSLLDTINSEIFARVFTSVKFRENETLAKW